MKGEHLKHLKGMRNMIMEFWSGNAVGIGVDVSIVFFTVEGGCGLA